MGETYASPDEEEILQEDVDANIEVVVAGVVRTQELPARIGAAKMWSAGTNGVQILTRDERRKSAIIVALDQDIKIGNGQNDVIGSTESGSVWPANVPLPIGSSDEWWVASYTDSTRVTAVIEYWAH